MTERRQTPRPRPGSTMRRILDITFAQIRKTEAEQGKKKPEKD